MLLAPADGIIICVHNLPLVNEGDALFHIARFGKEAGAGILPVFGAQKTAVDYGVGAGKVLAVGIAVAVGEIDAVHALHFVALAVGVAVSGLALLLFSWLISRLSDWIRFRSSAMEPAG